MNFIRKFNTLLLIMICSLYCLQTAYSETLSQIYQYLHSHYPQYLNITYAAPSQNKLYGTQWLIQTPDAWGQNLQTYNTGFTPAYDQKLLSAYQEPTCSDDSQCKAGRHCTALPYSLGIKLCTAPANHIQNRYFLAITQAQNSVDLATFQALGAITFTSGGFTTMLHNALTTLAKRSVSMNHPIYVRILQGAPLPVTVLAKQPAAKQSALKANFLQYLYLKKLVADFPKNNKLIISVTSERACVFTCANEDKQKSLFLDLGVSHAKILNIDSHLLITGGQNLYGINYLGVYPTNDLDFEIQGPIANGATRYTNHLWNFVYHHQNQFLGANNCDTYKNGQVTHTCPNYQIPLSDNKNLSYLPSNNQPVQAMYVSKLNNGILGKDADQSGPARIAAFSLAQHSIKMSQQAILASFLGHILYPVQTKYHRSVMQALAGALSRDVKIQIVTSNLKPHYIEYSSFINSVTLKQQFIQQLEQTPFNFSQLKATSVVNNNLSIRTVAYNSKDPQANLTSSHNKIWIVDDHIFYLGSHNIYPSSLTQFGVIIDSNAAATTLERQWWDPLWNHAIASSDNTAH